MPMPKRKQGVEQPPAVDSLLLPNTHFVERHVVIGDLHLRRTDPLGIIEQDGLNTRLKDKLQALNYAVTFAIKNRASHIDILGDVFEAVNPPENLKRLFWISVRPAIDAGMWVTILIGNHDTTGEFFNFAGDSLIAHERVRIVNKQALLVYTSDAEKSRTSVLYMPYLHQDDLLTQLNKYMSKTGKPSIILGHFEIEGAELAPDNAEPPAGERA